MKPRLLILTLLVGILFGGCSQKNPQIIFKTELGNITVELYPDKAPVTANNFLRYVNENRLDGATFYRTVTLDNQPDSQVLIEVIQGGLYEDNHPQALPPIEHETTEMTGILHKDGVISLARYGPGSATCEFFICVGDQPSLDYGGARNGDGQGFAAFGNVVDGMEVVHKIHQSSEVGQYLDPRIKINSIELVK